MPSMMTASVPTHRMPGHPDAENRIFVGGIPYYLTEEQCRELLGSFGAIKSFELIKDKETGMGKGCVQAGVCDLYTDERCCFSVESNEVTSKNR